MKLAKFYHGCKRRLPEISKFPNASSNSNRQRHFQRPTAIEIASGRTKKLKSGYHSVNDLRRAVSFSNDSNMKSPSISFSLRTLLLLIGVMSAGLWLLTQYNTTVGEFHIIDRDLEQGATGRVNGAISWRFTVLDEEGPASYGDAVCQLQNVAGEKIAGIQVGDRFRVRYRLSDVGWLKRGDPYLMFMSRRLGIRKDEIVGNVVMQNVTQIIVRGKVPPNRDVGKIEQMHLRAPKNRSVCFSMFQ